MHALNFALLLWIALLNPFAPWAWATTFAPRPFEQVVGDAPMILRGEVTLSRSDWAEGEDGSRRIYTFTDIRVREWLKGKPADFSGNQMTVREIGGTAGDVGMEVAGSAKFRTGEDVVLLVQNRRYPDGSYDLRGLMMSKLSVRRDAAGQEVLVGPAIAMGQNAPGSDHNDTDSGRRSWSMTDFKGLVASQAGQTQTAETAADSSVPPTQGAGESQTRAIGAPALQPASPESGAGQSVPTSESGEASGAGAAAEDEVPSDFPGNWFAFTLALGVAVLIAALVAWIRHRSSLRNRSF